MKTFIRWWLLVDCILVLIGCNVKPPSGQIFITDDTDGNLYVYDFASQDVQSWGEFRYLPESQGIHAWSPDYRQVVYNCRVDQQNNLCVYSLDTLDTEPLLESNHFYGEVFQSHPTWTLDGRGVTFVTTTNLPPLDKDYRQTLYTIDVQTKAMTRLTDLPNSLGDITSLAWISENELMTGFNHVFVTTGNILIWDAQTWEPRKVTEGLFPRWSPQTRRIAFMRYSLCLNTQTCFVGMPDRDFYWRKISSRLEIYTVDAQGTNEKLLYAAPPAPKICVRSHGLFWSPDGQYLAYTEGCGEMEKSDLYIMRIADGHIERLVEGLDFPAHALSWLK